MDELETTATTWKYDNESGSRHWIPDWSQDYREYRARRRWNYTSSKPCMDPASSMDLFQSSQWELLWVHSNQHLITYWECLQLLVRLCNRLLVIIVECYVHFDVIMQLRQMWCGRLDCGDRLNTYEKRKNTEEIPKWGSRPIDQPVKIGSQSLCNIVSCCSCWWLFPLCYSPHSTWVGHVSTPSSFLWI